MNSIIYRLLVGIMMAFALIQRLEGLLAFHFVLVRPLSTP